MIVKGINMQNSIKIEVSGVAGSGKSTLSRVIAEHLQTLGFEVEYKDENGTDVQDMVRERSTYEHIQAIGQLRERDVDVVVTTSQAKCNW